MAPPPRAPSRLAGIGMPIAGSAGSKIDTVSTDRNVAQSPTPVATGGNSNSDAFTYFTKATGKTEQVYAADRLWSKVTLNLETAGPVVVGIRNNLGDVLSGAGVLLDTGMPMSWTLPKGNKLYIASTTVNRVKVQVESFAWLESVTALVGQAVGALGDLVRGLVRR